MNLIYGFLLKPYLMELMANPFSVESFKYDVMKPKSS